MPGRSAQVGGLDPGLLADPLAFLAAEHARQRVLLGHLERLAGDRAGPRTAIARALAAWLASDLPLHLRDEEESLYPRLGSAEAATRGLVAGNRDSSALRARLRADLSHIAAGQRPSEGFAAAVRDFVAGYRRHLAVEENEVMPAAGRNLNGHDRAVIAREMLARRSLGETHA
jgi:hemerythrin-like domain-containing protein